MLIPLLGPVVHGVETLSALLAAHCPASTGRAMPDGVETLSALLLPTIFRFWICFDDPYRPAKSMCSAAARCPASTGRAMPDGVETLSILLLLLTALYRESIVVLLDYCYTATLSGT